MIPAERFLIAHPIIGGGPGPRPWAYAWDAIESLAPHPEQPGWAIVDFVSGTSVTIQFDLPNLIQSVLEET